MRAYRFHGNMIDAKSLTFKDREGVDFSNGRDDGDPYITTSVGAEFYVPGD